MLNIENLKFDANGLIPAIVVDSVTKQVLTLAYMNKESLKISMEKGLTCFWSRSRQELWLKGETSGHYQHIVSITADCDRDALVVEVVKDGPACHLGTDSCFNEVIYEGETPPAFLPGGKMCCAIHLPAITRSIFTILPDCRRIWGTALLPCSARAT